MGAKNSQAVQTIAKRTMQRHAEGDQHRIVIIEHVLAANPADRPEFSPRKGNASQKFMIVCGIFKPEL